MPSVKNAQLLIKAGLSAQALGLAVKVKAGKGQLVRVTFDSRGRSTETTQSEWLDGAQLDAEVEKRLAIRRDAQRPPKPASPCSWRFTPSTSPFAWCGSFAPTADFACLMV